MSRIKLPQKAGVLGVTVIGAAVVGVDGVVAVVRGLATSVVGPVALGVDDGRAGEIPCDRIVPFFRPARSQLTASPEWVDDGHCRTVGAVIRLNADLQHP